MPVVHDTLWARNVTSLNNSTEPQTGTSVSVDGGANGKSIIAMIAATGEYADVYYEAICSPN